MNELITVIVPIYKVELYLRECIESILNQTYENLEIILVDDGSPDNCGNICDEYAKADKRIKVIHKQNGGLSDARNAGIDIAKGEYISFIDSDDYIKNTFIQTLYDLAKNYNADISIGNYQEFFENQKIEKDINENIIIKEKTNQEILEELYNNESYIYTVIASNKLYKRELFKNLRYKKGKIHEDEFMVHKIIMQTNKNIVTTTEKLYYYRKRKDSITTTKFNRKSLDWLEALEDRKQFYESIGNKRLLEKTTVFSQYILAQYYCLTKKNIENNEEDLKYILKLSRQNYRQLLKMKSLSSQKTKIKFLGFVCFPDLVYRINKNEIKEG